MAELLPWIQGVAFLVAGVWAVSAIRSTTEVLGERISSLKTSLEKFQTVVERVHDDHEERIRNLERQR